MKKQKQTDAFNEETLRRFASIQTLSEVIRWDEWMDREERRGRRERKGEKNVRGKEWPVRGRET